MSNNIISTCVLKTTKLRGIINETTKSQTLVDSTESSVDQIMVSDDVESQTEHVNNGTTPPIGLPVISIKPAIGGMPSAHPTTMIVSKKSPTSHEYRDLFTALLKIKDSKLTSRILEVINESRQLSTPTIRTNGTNVCSKCLMGGSRTKSTASTATQTQTESDTVSNNKSCQTYEKDFRYWRMVTSTCKSLDGDVKIKRKRGPHAVNSLASPSEQSNDDTPAQTIRFKLRPSTSIASTSRSTSPIKLTSHQDGNLFDAANNTKNLPAGIVLSSTDVRSIDNDDVDAHSLILVPTEDYVPEIFDYDADSLLLDETPHELMPPQSLNEMIKETSDRLDQSNAENNSLDNVMRQMRREWLIAGQVDPSTGLFPIHLAALNGDLNALRRQLVVYNVCKRDINILSQELDEDGKIQQQQTALHYAVLAPEPIGVTKLLLESGASLLFPNSQGDNVLHYAATHCVDLKLFEILLANLFRPTAKQEVLLDPMNELLAINDAGQSLVHTLINQPNTFLHLKSLVDSIDQHLSIESPGKDVADTTRLMQLYRNHIYLFDKPPLPINLRHEKMTVLNQPESLCGRTPLFLALKQNATPSVLLLLAHYADPLVADRSGVDCSMLVKDECQYRNVYTYVMKAFCLQNSMNPVRVTNIGCKRRYIKRKETDVVDDSGFEDSLPTVAKRGRIIDVII